MQEISDEELEKLRIEFGLLLGLKVVTFDVK